MTINLLSSRCSSYKTLIHFLKTKVQRAMAMPTSMKVDQSSNQHISNKCRVWLRQPRSLIYQVNFSNCAIYASVIFNSVQYSHSLISIKKPCIMAKWQAFFAKNLSRTLIPSAPATLIGCWLKRIAESQTGLQAGRMQSQKISCRSLTKRMWIINSKKQVTMSKKMRSCWMCWSLIASLYSQKSALWLTTLTPTMEFKRW